MSDNDQQDVSEFTHIVLEWVEEAFKEPEAVTSSLTSKSGVPEMMDEGSNDQVFQQQLKNFIIIGDDSSRNAHYFRISSFSRK